MYRSYFVPTDGNCLFHCIGFAVYAKLVFQTFKTTNFWFYLWQLEWMAGEGASQPHNSRQTSLYLYSMFYGNGWGTTTEITAASLLFGYHVTLWIAGTNEENVMCYNAQNFFNLNNGEADTIYLLLSGNHFHLLQREHIRHLISSQLFRASKQGKPWWW